MAVQGIGQVRQHNWVQAEQPDQVLDVFQVTGGQVGARQYIDLARTPTRPGSGIAGSRHQLLDDGRNRQGVTGLHGAGEIRRRYRHHRNASNWG